MTDKRAEIRAALAADPMEMTLQLSKRLGVPEADVIRELPDGRAVELDVSRWEELFHALAECGQVHVIVSNATATCEVTGTFGGFSTWGEFFNVQTSSLDLHIRFARIASIWAIEKPSHTDGTRTLSVQLYDTDGAAAMKVFLVFAGKPSEKRLGQFAAIKERFILAQRLLPGAAAPGY
jgi:putative hemin transport protein